MFQWNHLFLVLLYKPRITAVIFKSIKTKNKLFKSHFIHGDYKDKLYFKKYRNHLPHCLRMSKISYYQNKFDKCKNNPAETWRTLKIIIGDKSNT